MAWKEVKKGGQRGKDARKHRTYSDAKCSIVECWFSVIANYFVYVFACKESSTREY
jgi:hypothetical protein